MHKIRRGRLPASLKAARCFAIFARRLYADFTLLLHRRIKCDKIKRSRQKLRRQDCNTARGLSERKILYEKHQKRRIFSRPCGKKSGKSGIKLDYVEPTDPKAGNTVAHAAVSKWDQTFSYGDASIKCTALTRFNDGQTAAGEKKEQGLRLTGQRLKEG